MTCSQTSQSLSSCKCIPTICVRCRTTSCINSNFRIICIITSHLFSDGNTTSQVRWSCWWNSNSKWTCTTFGICNGYGIIASRNIWDFSSCPAIVPKIWIWTCSACNSNFCTSSCYASCASDCTCQRNSIGLGNSYRTRCCTACVICHSDSISACSQTCNWSCCTAAAPIISIRSCSARNTHWSRTITATKTRNICLIHCQNRCIWCADSLACHFCTAICVCDRNSVCTRCQTTYWSCCWTIAPSVAILRGATWSCCCQATIVATTSRISQTDTDCNCRWLIDCYTAGCWTTAIGSSNGVSASRQIVNRCCITTITPSISDCTCSSSYSSRSRTISTAVASNMGCTSR